MYYDIDLCIWWNPRALSVKHMNQLLNHWLQGQNILDHDTFAKERIEIEVNKCWTNLEGIEIECEDFKFAK